MVPRARFGLDFLSQGCHAEVAAGVGNIPGVPQEWCGRILESGILLWALSGGNAPGLRATGVQGHGDVL